jgi:hypothetical protein
MKALILLFVAVVFASPTFAQDSTATPPQRQAPVGHRQPTVASVHKAMEEKGEKNVGTSTISQRGTSTIDQNLIICKGC